jgi:hypothetical protein
MFVVDLLGLYVASVVVAVGLTHGHRLGNASGDAIAEKFDEAKANAQRALADRKRRLAIEEVDRVSTKVDSIFSKPVPVS